MKLAIAADGRQVAGHFGHCEGFVTFEVGENEFGDEAFIQNPGHKKGFLPGFLHDHGVDVIVAGGMGQAAIDLFAQNNIDVFTGAQGDVTEIAKAFAEGTLVSTGSVCTKHEHHESNKDNCDGSGQGHHHH